MDFTNFKWLNETDHEITENGIEIYAPGNTDYFVNPVNGKVTANAPFFYKEVKGDFILKAKIALNFESFFDAGVLLALDHDTLWAKACFEYTDFDTHAVVTVITNKKSDDADEIWLQLSRKDDVFAIHYSLDGEKFTMARLAALPMSKKIKVGFEAQSPTGEGGKRIFENVSLQLEGPENIRAGK